MPYWILWIEPGFFPSAEITPDTINDEINNKEREGYEFITTFGPGHILFHKDVEEQDELAELDASDG